MNRTTAHNRFSRLTYNSPKRSNIYTGVNISIYIVSAVIALKRLVLPIANMLANRTGFRSISRLNDHKINDVEFCFVLQETKQLIERPATKFCSKLFIPTLRGKADVSQIFNSNSFAM